jgi:hypothetical protein
MKNKNQETDKNIALSVHSNKENIRSKATGKLR